MAATWGRLKVKDRRNKFGGIEEKGAAQGKCKTAVACRLRVKRRISAPCAKFDRLQCKRPL